MPGENADLVRRLIDAFGRGDTDASLALLHPDVEWRVNLPDGEVWRGHEGVLGFFRSWVGTWDDYAYEQTELIDAGEAVVSVFRERGRGKGSGLEIDTEFAGVFVVRDGLVVSWTRHPSRAEALAAAGLA